MVGQSKKAQVFVCYAHKDEEWLSRLLVHLEPLQLQEQAEIWSDSKIELGEA